MRVFTALAAARAAAAPCFENVAVLYQRKDPSLDLVVNVLARSDGGERLLVLANGSDTSTPCALDWWLSHEVQGTAHCVPEATPKAAPSFLALRGPSGCAPCTQEVDNLGSGYLRTLAALSTTTPGGAPREPGTVAVLGLGAGLLPAWLLARTKANVHAVDVAAAVVDAAPCFGLEEGPRLHLHVADGRAFLEAQPEASMDTIVVDAFDPAAAMASTMRTAEFFAMVRDRLTPSGVLLLNLLTCESDADPTTCGPFRDGVVASVQAAFPHTYLADAPGAVGSQSVLLAPVGAAPDSPPPVDASAWFQDAHVRPLKLVHAEPWHDAA